MIKELIIMNSYGPYVWSAFSFTLVSFITLYFVVRTNLLKEENKFFTKFGKLQEDQIKMAKSQPINREILASRIISKI